MKNSLKEVSGKLAREAPAASARFKFDDALLKKGMKGAGVALLGYFALNFFKSDQLSNAANPLDLFSSLESQGDNEYNEKVVNGEMQLPTGSNFVATKQNILKKAYIELGNPMHDDNMVNRAREMFEPSAANPDYGKAWKPESYKFYYAKRHNYHKAGNVILGNYGSYSERSKYIES